MQQVFVAQITHDPFRVTCDGQASRTPRNVAYFQNREFHGGVYRHVNPHLGSYAVFGMLEHGITKAMPNDIGRRAARRQRCRRPKLSSLLIANVKGLARGVLNGIVAPGRQSKFMGILHPSVSCAAFGNNCTEKGIGQDIDPRRRRHLAGLEGDDIFVAIAGKAAQAVREIQLPLRERLRPLSRPRPDRRQCWDPGIQNTPMFQLFAQSSLFIVQYNPRRGLKQYPVVAGNLFKAPDEDAAGLVQRLRFNAGRDQACDPVMQ